MYSLQQNCSNRTAVRKHGPISRALKGTAWCIYDFLIAWYPGYRTHIRRWRKVWNWWSYEWNSKMGAFEQFCCKTSRKHSQHWYSLAGHIYCVHLICIACTSQILVDPGFLGCCVNIWKCMNGWGDHRWVDSGFGCSEHYHHIGELVEQLLGLSGAQYTCWSALQHRASLYWQHWADLRVHTRGTGST